MSPENEQFLRQLVEHKRFPNYEAALNATVGFARCEYEKDIAGLKAKIDQGLKDIDEGRCGPLDIEKMKRELRNRWEGERERAEAG